MLTFCVGVGCQAVIVWLLAGRSFRTIGAISFLFPKLSKDQKKKMLEITLKQLEQERH
jgi:hypothetical protein